MIYAADIRYSHTGELNRYTVYYHDQKIGTIRHTPGTAGTWTFTNSTGTAQTFGSTRLQAVGFYIEQFMKGERESGKEEQYPVNPFL